MRDHTTHPVSRFQEFMIYQQQARGMCITCMYFEVPHVMSFAKEYSFDAILPFDRYPSLTPEVGLTAIGQYL